MTTCGFPHGVIRLSVFLFFLLLFSSRLCQKGRRRQKGGRRQKVGRRQKGERRQKRRRKIKDYVIWWKLIWGVNQVFLVKYSEFCWKSSQIGDFWLKVVNLVKYCSCDILVFIRLWMGKNTSRDIPGVSQGGISQGVSHG